jgi:MFS transporter, AAHS family, benzoate transport protein
MTDLRSMHRADDDVMVEAGGERVAWLVTALCWIALFSEGYDMGALGAVLPAMMTDAQWHISPVIAGLVGSAALAGMFFGGYLMGLLADRFGRKPAYVTAFTLFSLASGVGAMMPTVPGFSLCRFLAGVGVGGIVPIASALTSEYAPAGKANRFYAVMYSGYSVGIFAAAAVSALSVQTLGWRFVIGLGAAPLLLLPVILRYLPESMRFLQTRGRQEDARRLAARLGLPLPAPRLAAGASPAAGIRALFQPGYAQATWGFWLTTFAAMILVYGLNTWLPQIMRTAGYDLGSSIMFLGVFALSSSVGGVMLGLLADRIGQGPTIVAGFAMGAVAILCLAQPHALAVTYAIVAIAGIGAVSSAIMVTSYLSSYFPPEYRATAVGSCLSFSRFGAVSGPILGGFVAKWHLDISWNFKLFALAAILSALAITLVPRLPDRA